RVFIHVDHLYRPAGQKIGRWIAVWRRQGWRTRDLGNFASNRIWHEAEQATARVERGRLSGGSRISFEQHIWIDRRLLHPLAGRAEPGCMPGIHAAMTAD